MRNKAGGAVFTKTRFGSMLRRKVSPTQPRSTTQMNVRADFTALAKEWSGATMTDTKRAGWTALADSYPVKDIFGNSQRLTGMQLFIACNRALTTIGQPQITNAPSSLQAGYPGAITVTATAPSTLSVAFATPTTGNDFYALFAAPQQSPGRAGAGSRYRYLGLSGYGAGPITAGPTYVAKFGNLIAGKKVPIKLLIINGLTGAKGLPSTALQVVS
jgi:hypothetical protein